MFCDLHGNSPCFCDYEDNVIPNYIDYCHRDIDEYEYPGDFGWEDGAECRPYDNDQDEFYAENGRYAGTED